MGFGRILRQTSKTWIKYGYVPITLAFGTSCNFDHDKRDYIQSLNRTVTERIPVALIVLYKNGIFDRIIAKSVVPITRRYQREK